MTTKQSHLQLIDMFISHYESNIADETESAAKAREQGDTIKTYGAETSLYESRFALGKLKMIKKSAEGLKD